MRSGTCVSGARRAECSGHLHGQGPGRGSRLLETNLWSDRCNKLMIRGHYLRVCGRTTDEEHRNRSERSIPFTSPWQWTEEWNSESTSTARRTSTGRATFCWRTGPKWRPGPGPCEELTMEEDTCTARGGESRFVLIQLNRPTERRSFFKYQTMPSPEHWETQ